MLNIPVSAGPLQDSDLKQYLDSCGNLMSMHNVKVSRVGSTITQLFFCHCCFKIAYSVDPEYTSVCVCVSGLTYRSSCTNCSEALLTAIRGKYCTET